MRRRAQVICTVTTLLTIAVIVQTILFVKTPGSVHLVASLVEVRFQTIHPSSCLKLSANQGFIAVILCNLAVVLVGVRHLLGFHNKKVPVNCPTFTDIDFADVSFHTILSPPDLSTKSQSFPQVKTGASKFMDRWRTVGSAIDSDDDERMPVQIAQSYIPRTSRTSRLSGSNTRDTITV